MSSRYSPNTFLLTGKVDLVYEKRWTSDHPDDDRQKFAHTYRLGLNGFIIDKRLISFDLAGSFSQAINSPGETLDSHGFSARIGFLNKKPRKGLLTYFPQPINLRYSDFESLDTKSQSYGVSFTYKPTENPVFSRKIAQMERERRLKKIMKQAPRKKKEEEEEESEEEETEGNGNKNKNGNNKNNGNNGEPPAEEKEKIFEINRFPTFFLDYDKYKYEFGNANTETDYFDLRAQSLNKNVYLQAEYTYNNFKGSETAKYQDLDMDADLHFYNDKAATRLDVLNTALLRDNDNLQSLDLLNRTIWQRRLGQDRRDMIVLRGNGNYFISDNDENYEVGASGSYLKVFSPKLRDDVIVDLSQGHTDNGAIYNINAANGLTYVLSKTFTATNSLSAGQTEIGSNIAAGLGLLANIRAVPVHMSANYDFSSKALDEGRTNSNRLALTIRGRLARDLSFSTRNSYHISDVEDREPSQERGYELRGDLYWRISKFSINAGASDTSTERTWDSGANIADSVSLRTTSLYSNISVYFSRRMFLTVASTYTTESNGKSRTDIHPVLSWYARQVTLTAEYIMRNESGLSSGTDHRVLVRLTRKFEKRLRPFW